MTLSALGNVRGYTRLVLFGVAVAATVASLKINLDLAAILYPADDAARLNYQIFAVLSAAAKLALPMGLAITSGAWFAKAVGWFLVGAFVFYDIVGAVAYDRLTRGAPASHVAGDAKAYHDAEADVAAWRRRVDDVHARTLGEISAAKKIAEAEAVGCGKKYNLTEARCTEPARLEGEAARAKQKAEHEAEWHAARDKLAKLKPPAASPTDALADALADLAGAIGLSATGRFIALIFSIRLIICLELLPPLASFLALHGVALARRPSAAPASGPTSPKPRAPRGGGVPVGDVLSALRSLAEGTRSAPGVSAAAGRVSGSQRALAAACGVSPSAMNAVLKGLASAGGVRVASSSSGTTVHLA